MGSTKVARIGRLPVVLHYLVLFGAIMFGHGAGARGASSTETFTDRAFGIVHVYRPAGAPSQVVLFASGDGGFNLGVVDMAQELVQRGALVAGFDTPAYLRYLDRSGTRCGYPAGDLERLGDAVQQRYHLDHHHTPILVGYSSGATLVYGALAAAPAGTFAGGISLGFQPSIAVHARLCRGDGLHSTPARDGQVLKPTRLPVPWKVLQGLADREALPSVTENFCKDTANADYIPLSGVGHGFAVRSHWLGAYLQAWSQIVASQRSPVPAPAAVADLPIVEVPARNDRGKVLAIMLSGDGGWVGIDRKLGSEIAAAGIPVVGFNSLNYFWSKRTEPGMAADLGRLIEYYTKAWQRSRVVLVGYSRGADVLPFMVRSLAPGQRSRVELIALLGPATRTALEIHVTDWFSNASRSDELPLEPAMAAIADIPALCIYGSDERDSLCPVLPHRPNLTVEKMPGGHHFDGNYATLARRILAAVETQ